MMPKSFLVKGLLLAVLASPCYATSVSYTYTDPAVDSLTASFTLDVNSGFATSGSGTVTSSLFGTLGLTLLTNSSTLPSGDGSINPTAPAVPGGFTWHGVVNSGGADFQADSAVSSSPSYLDIYGLMFELTSGTTVVGGLNIFSDNGSAASVYDTVIGYNGGCTGPCYSGSSQGTLTPTAVPLPAALPLLLSGSALFGYFGRRRLKVQKA